VERQDASKLASAFENLLLTDKKFAPKLSLSETKSSASGSKLRKGISKLEMNILEEVNNRSKKDHFVSLHDLERILPDRRIKIMRALLQLTCLGLIKVVKVGERFHFSSPEMVKNLRHQMHYIANGDHAEIEIIELIRQCLIKLYPNALYSGSEGFATYKQITDFDIIFEFKSVVLSKQFLVANVFTKMSVDHHIVNSFIKKIDRTQVYAQSSCRGAKGVSCSLRGKTLRLIICGTFSREATKIAASRGVSLINFSDIPFCHDRLRSLLNF
jgi:hypothetical protein